MITDCPHKRQPFSGEKSRTVGVTAALLPSGAPTTLPAVLQSEGITHTVAALIDSGAEGDLMDIELARQWGIPVCLISGNHTEEI